MYEFGIKSTVDISQNFVAFSEYMNLNEDFGNMGCGVFKQGVQGLTKY